jgi:hypothetical protein
MFFWGDFAYYPYRAPLMCSISLLWIAIGWLLAYKLRMNVVAFWNKKDLSLKSERFVSKIETLIVALWNKIGSKLAFRNKSDFSTNNDI